MSGVDDAVQALDLADSATARADIDAEVAHLSAAIRRFTAADDQRQAAMACVRLGEAFAYGLGNLTAGRAWFGRAQRLVASEPPCVEQGWVAVAALGCDVDDPAELLAASETALDLARRFGDVNLEAKALADAGLAHVQSGRMAKGMALLDEAMALVCGPADDIDVAAKSVCSFFTACYYSADFERAGSWADLLRRGGLISPLEPGGPAFLSSHCDSVHATLLLELGRWGEAEAVLTRAKMDFETAMRSPSWHPDIALADLRTRQGRFVEAEALLLGKDQAMQALLPAARLHLARGDADLARATAQRGLRAIAADQLRVVELLTVLVEAELARGDLEAAVAYGADLATRASRLEVPTLTGRAAGIQARIQAATGQTAEAVSTVEAAVDLLTVFQLPWLRATLLIDLARLRDLAGDRAGATVDAAAAAAALADLDVVLPAGDAALLDRLVPPRRSGLRERSTASLDGGVRGWLVSHEGTSVRLRETKGLRYLAELLDQPGVERHALDLVDRVEGVAPAGGVDRRQLGDAGAMLDSRARATYRRRIEALRAEIDDEMAAGQLERAEALQDEVDQLVQELARAFGLGGRSRRAASVSERARLNVTRALRAAIARIAEALPEAGGVLERRVRTGLYCVYEPEEDDEVGWIVQR